jgi:hypothetical protein
VATRRWIFFLLPAAMLAVLAACGGGSTANVQNPPAPSSSPVSIAFQSAPATSIFVNATPALTAVVSNDPTNSGVDWSLTCQNTNNCGTLTTLHTSSGQANTYTPPTTFTGNSMSVNIVAFATANHSQNVLAPITISAFGSNLKGSYVFQTQGTGINSGPYELAGVMIFNGNGGITSGEQTVNFYDQNPNISTLVSRADPITGGNYFLGPDGRGTITVNTNDQDVGTNGVETFSFVFLSTSESLIAETDASESGTGTMNLQTSTAAPTGGYAFAVSGTDITSGLLTAFGGIFNINSPNLISGAGSIADQNLGGTITARQPLTGTTSAPDAFGGVTLNLAMSGFQSATNFQFTGYIVNATQMFLVESDNSTGTGSASTGGIAIGQGSATGTFTNNTSFSGTYVFGILGVDLTGFTPNNYTSAGVFKADGMGDLIDGYTDTFLQLNGDQGFAGSQISGTFTGTYQVSPTGIGHARGFFSHFSPHPNPGYLPLYYFYLTGNGNPILFLDASDTALDYPSLGVGIAYPQSAPTTNFAGDYGISFTQQNGTENDGTGQMTATSGNWSGVVDDNNAFTPTFDSPITGTYVAPQANGLSPLDTLSGAPPFDFSPFIADFYVINPTQGFFIETDLINPTTPSGVVTFGYYGARTPVCATCP